MLKLFRTLLQKDGVKYVEAKSLCNYEKGSRKLFACSDVLNFLRILSCKMNDFSISMEDYSIDLTLDFDFTSVTFSYPVLVLTVPESATIFPLLPLPFEGVPYISFASISEDVHVAVPVALITPRYVSSLAKAFALKKRGGIEYADEFIFPSLSLPFYSIEETAAAATAAVEVLFENGYIYNEGAFFTCKLQLLLSPEISSRGFTPAS